MAKLNYNHLRCFWAVAREGSVAAACKLLDLRQPTISKQISELEDSLGETLFRRAGNRLSLTDKGRTAFSYADEMFALEHELVESVQGRMSGRLLELRAGVSSDIPELLASSLLQPVFLPERSEIHLVCREGQTEQLLSDLSAADLDVVLTDAPVPSGSSPQLFNHRLGSTPVSLFGPKELAARYRASFPKSLEEAPLVLPTAGSSLRAALDNWFASLGVRPRVIAETDDTALLTAIAASGRGLFFAPTRIGPAVMSQYDAGVVGRAEGIACTYYAVTRNRRTHHPAVARIIEKGALDGEALK